jgi:hypothetical protein
MLSIVRADLLVHADLRERLRCTAVHRVVRVTLDRPGMGGA